MKKTITFCMLMLAATLVNAQTQKPPAVKTTCPAGDPWALASGGRQHIIQNSKVPVQVKICYCEGGKIGDYVDVVTVDDSYPGKPDPKGGDKGSNAAKSGDKSGKNGPIGTKGNTSTALGFGSCGDYAGQSVYLANRNKFNVSGIYAIRDKGGKDK
jgi:hypothetical protein